MRTVFEGSVRVAYMQMYVEAARRRYRSRGITGRVRRTACVAPRWRGFLFLITGVHTGHVGLTIEVHEGPPTVDGRWEEVVEAPFTPQTRAVRLAQWADVDACEFELDTVEYRVRYCAVGMDEASAHGVVLDGELPVDRYLLRFRPAPSEPDRVVRQTSDKAAYWHKFAREQPPPAPRERAEAGRVAREARVRARTERVREYEPHQWAGRLPTERLRRVGGNVHRMRMLDVHLVHAIARVGDATQCEIARWVAHRAHTLAGLADVDWTLCRRCRASGDRGDRAHGVPAWDQAAGCALRVQDLWSRAAPCRSASAAHGTRARTCPSRGSNRSTRASSGVVTAAEVGPDHE
ncbi:hypothetical protein ACFZBU_40560 [Embleya sp. NPDC008237]|uniref:hypothetical protein n=1 Tax=Embleya sp. NPDC008237 TaxID=3363978 RepID=UPI0036EB0A18